MQYSRLKHSEVVVLAVNRNKVDTSLAIHFKYISEFMHIDKNLKVNIKKALAFRELLPGFEGRLL